MILPRNPNPNFSKFVSYFTCNASVLDHFFNIFMGLSFCFTCLLFVFFSHVKIRIYISFLCFNTMNTHSHVHILIPWVLRCNKVSKISHAFTCTCILFVILFRIDERDMMNKHVVFLMFSMISWRCHVLFITYVSALNMIWWHGVRWMLGGWYVW